MRNILIFIGIILLASCGGPMDFKSAMGLDFNDFMFAKNNDQGTLTKVDDRVFSRGENVNMILLGVGSFKKDNEGLNWFDMDIEVTAPDGTVVLSQKELLGENGHVLLPNDIADSPYGIFKTDESLEPGKYKIKLSIYDKIGTGKASQSAYFTLK